MAPMSNDFRNSYWCDQALKNPSFGMSDPISEIERHRRLAPQKIENGYEMGPHGSKWHKNTIILHSSSRSISWRPSRSEKSILEIRMCNFGIQKSPCGNGHCKDRTCKKNDVRLFDTFDGPKLIFYCRQIPPRFWEDRFLIKIHSKMLLRCYFIRLLWRGYLSGDPWRRDESTKNR